VQGLGWLGLLGLLYRRYHIGAPVYWFMSAGQRSRSDYPLHAFNIDDVFTMFRHVRVSETTSPLCVPRQVPFARVEPPIDTLPPVVAL
jgi:hypothetical protein